MKTKLLLTTILLVAIGLSSASAQVRQREHNQRERIVQGKRSGELTPRETRRLAYEQRDIRHDIHRAKTNDGHIGPRERAHIRRDENRTSRDIYRAKHNSRKRF
jgi:hypothetical protein